MVIACKILNGFVVKNVSFTTSLTAYFFIVCVFYGFDYVNHIFGRISSTFIKHNDSFLFFEAYSSILAQLLYNTAVLSEVKSTASEK